MVIKQNKLNLTVYVSDNSFCWDFTNCTCMKALGPSFPQNRATTKKSSCFVVGAGGMEMLLHWVLQNARTLFGQVGMNYSFIWVTKVTNLRSFMSAFPRLGGAGGLAPPDYEQ